MKNNACKRVSTDREAIKLLSSWQSAQKITSIDRDMCRESIENVSSRQRAQKFGSMDRPSCREAIVVKSKNLDRKNLCQVAVEMLSRRYQAAIDKVEARFFKGGKTHKMNAT